MEIIDQIRQVANIVDIASQYTTLKRRGKKYVGLCPFHSEKDPSFTVDEEKQLFHCFGCGAGGDVFTLVMEKENLSFPEAMRSLAQRYNLTIPQKSRLSPQLAKLEEQIFKVNENALAFFRKNLFRTAEGERALHYLKKRAITDQIAQELKIGYALNSWNSLVSFFEGKGEEAKILEKAGLVLYNEKKNSYYDRFRGRIIFPIFSLTGKVVAFGGRTIFDEEPKYLNSPDTPVYSKGKLLYGLNLCKESIRGEGTAIIVEGYTDFLALYQAGIKNVAASLGTSLTPDQVSLAQRFAPRMIISYDGDAAGRNAALRAIPICFERGAEVRVLTLPSEVDPDNFIKEHGAEEFRILIQKSIPALKFFVDSLLEGGRAETPEEKARIARNVVAEVEKIPDPIIRSEYLKWLSEYLVIDEGLIRRMIQEPRPEDKPEEREAFLPAEKRLLQILLEDETIAPYVFGEIKEEYFHGLKSKPIFVALRDCFKNDIRPTFHELKQKVEPSLSSSLSKALLEKEQLPTVEEAFECLNALRQLSLENRSKELKAEIAKSERNGEKEKVGSLLAEMDQIKKQLLDLSQRKYENLSLNSKDGLAKNRS